MPMSYSTVVSNRISTPTWGSFKCFPFNSTSLIKLPTENRSIKTRKLVINIYDCERAFVINRLCTKELLFYSALCPTNDFNLYVFRSPSWLHLNCETPKDCNQLFSNCNWTYLNNSLSRSRSKTKINVQSIFFRLLITNCRILY